MCERGEIAAKNIAYFQATTGNAAAEWGEVTAAYEMHCQITVNANAATSKHVVVAAASAAAAVAFEN